VNKIDYADAIGFLRSSDIQDFLYLEKMIAGFPSGCDDFINRYWITNAIDCGSLESVKWIVSKGVKLNFRDDEGYSPIHSCINRDFPDKYEILKILIDADADIHIHGTNDYTPLHLAAALDDLKAIKILLQAGANIDSRTRIDEYATPEEEARSMGSHMAADFLKDFRNKIGKAQ